MFRTKVLFRFAAPHRGPMQLVVAVPAVPLHGDCARFHWGRPAEGLPDARHGEWPDRDRTTGDCVTPDAPLGLSGVPWPNTTRYNETIFVLQFFAWFAKLQNNMDQDENVKYRWVEISFLFLWGIYYFKSRYERMELLKCLAGFIRSNHMVNHYCFKISVSRCLLWCSMYQNLCLST